MFIGKKDHIHTRSFRHRIRENFRPFFDESHLMGLDPFDNSKFYPHREEKRKKRNLIDKIPA